MFYQDNTHKIGIEEKDINIRLQTHRTTYPLLKMKYLVYTTKVNTEAIEFFLLNRFKSCLLEINHEVVISVHIDKLVNSVNMFTSMSFLDVTVETQEELEKYNDS